MQSRRAVRPSLQVAFEEIKAIAQTAATGRVLVYAHESETARGCGWLQNPTPEQTEKLMASLKGEVRTEELHNGKDST